VIESATTRDRKRYETAQRITACALRLTDRHGLDGYTMEQLAAAADVSRRTLFNYFPTKLDAVLGAAPEVPAEHVDAFRAGGPHGDLVEDLAELARVALSGTTQDRATVEIGRRLLAGEPRLLVATHRRFEGITDEFVTLVLEREGAGFDPARARLLLRVVLTVFDLALDAFVADRAAGGADLVDLFDRQLRDVRELFR